MKKMVVLMVPFLMVACGKKENVVIQVEPGVVGKIEGRQITDEDIRKVVGAAYVQAEIGLYDARKEGLDRLIEDHLLQKEAEKKGVTKEDLLKQNVQDKVKITDAQINKFYEENKTRFGGRKLEDFKDNIRLALAREEEEKARKSYVDRLRKGADIQVLIAAPKLEVPIEGAPKIGPDNAPVKLVEFTDYQCPFCGRVRPTVDKIMKEYNGKVQYVIRDFPLSFHQDAFKAHEAAYCAGDQDKYWPMNKKLFGEQKSLKMDDLKKYAKEIGLKEKEFDDCLSSGKFAAQVRQGLQDGQEVGVSGTPAFFINGRMISGARPFEAFKEVIDDELAAN